ncbi:MAG: hypothetical protein AMS16_01075 [Planctomycetes bacterium DG_58]|nr:MAG: hypothetical protein AMS16_01075 [Planctomycetes bacterium DG_58]
MESSLTAKAGKEPVMSRFFVVGLLSVLLISVGLTFAAEEDDEADRDNPPIPSARIRRVTINVFPNEVIVVKGKMVELKKLSEHLKELVPDARKAAVEVIILPHSKKEMPLVSKIIIMAKKLGYTKVSFEGPRKQKPKLTEITILLSRTGDLFVEDDLITEKELKGKLEQLVEEKRRPKVRIYIRASRLVKRKKVAEISKLCQSLGFKDIVFGIIAE